MDSRRPPAGPAGGAGGEEEDVGLRYVPSPAGGPSTPYLRSLQAQLPRSNYDSPAAAARSPAVRIEPITALHAGPRGGQPSGAGLASPAVTSQRPAGVGRPGLLLQVGSGALSDSSDDGDAPLYGERIPLESGGGGGGSGRETPPSSSSRTSSGRPPVAALGAAGAPTSGQRRIAGSGTGGTGLRRASGSDGGALAAAQQEMASEMARMLAAAGLSGAQGGGGAGAAGATPGGSGSAASKHSALQTPLQFWEAPASPRRRGLRLDLGGSSSEEENDDDDDGTYMPAVPHLQIEEDSEQRRGGRRPSLLLVDGGDTGRSAQEVEDDVGLVTVDPSNSSRQTTARAQQQQRPTLLGFDQSLSSSAREPPLPRPGDRPQLAFGGGFGDTLGSTGGGGLRGGGGRPGLAIGFGDGDSDNEDGDDDDDDEGMYGARIEDHDLPARPQIAAGGARGAGVGRGDSLDAGGPDWGVSTSGTLNLAGIVAIKESGIKAWANTLVKGGAGEAGRGGGGGSSVGAARPGSGQPHAHGGSSHMSAGGSATPSTSLSSAPGPADGSDASERSKNIKDELVSLDMVGRGASSTVDRALHIPTLQLVAVKNVSLFDEGVRAQMARELKVLYANLTPLVPVVVGPRGGVEEVTDATLSASAMQAGLDAGSANALTATFSGLQTGASPASPSYDDEESADGFSASALSLSALLDPMAALPPAPASTPADGSMPDLSMTLSGAAARPLLARSLSAPSDLSAVMEAQAAAAAASAGAGSGSDGATDVSDGSGVAMVVAATCPYVLRLYDAFTNSKRAGVSIVLEYCGGGSLQDVLDAGGCRSEPALARMAAHLLRGLAFLHARCLLHRDIKPANVLMTRLGDGYKVADLGVSRVLKRNNELSDDGGEGTAALARTWAGTMVYMAPERLDTSTGGGYGLPSDIWSAGLTILAVAAGRFPYPDTSAGMYWDMVNTVKNGPVPLHVLDEVAAATGCSFSPQFRDFLAQALTKDPAARPTAEALLSHPWLRGHWTAASKRRGSLPEPGGPGSPTDPLSCPVGVSLADVARDAGAAASSVLLPPRLCKEYGPFSARTTDQQEAALATLNRLVAELTGMDTAGVKPAASDKERGWREFLRYFRRLRPAEPAAGAAGSNKRLEVEGKVGADSDEDDDDDDVVPSFLPGKPVGGVARAATDSSSATLSASTSSAEQTWGSERGRDFLARSLDETAFNDFLAGRIQRAAEGLTATLRAPIALGATLTADTLRTTLSVRRTVSSTPPPVLGLTGGGGVTAATLGTTLNATSAATLARLASAGSSAPPTYEELALEPRDIEGLAAQLGLPPLLVLAVVNDGIKARVAADASKAASAAGKAPAPAVSSGAAVKGLASPQKTTAQPAAASIVGLAVQSPTSVPRIRVPAEANDRQAEASSAPRPADIVTSPLFALPSDRKYAPGLAHPRSTVSAVIGGTGTPTASGSGGNSVKAGPATDTPRAGVPFSTAPSTAGGQQGNSGSASAVPAGGAAARPRGWWSPSPHDTPTPGPGAERRRDSTSSHVSSGGGGDSRGSSPSRAQGEVAAAEEPPAALKTPASFQARLFAARRRDSRGGGGEGSAAAAAPGTTGAAPPRPASSGPSSRPGSAHEPVPTERMPTLGMRRPSFPAPSLSLLPADVTTPSYFSASASPGSPDGVHSSSQPHLHAQHHQHHHQLQHQQARPHLEPSGGGVSASTPQSSASSLSSPYYMTALGQRRRSSLTGLAEAPRSVARPPSGGGHGHGGSGAATGGGGFHGLFHPDSPAEAYPSLIPGRPGLLVGASPGGSGSGPASYLPGDWAGLSTGPASRPSSHAGASRVSSAGSQRRPPSRLEPLNTSPAAAGGSPYGSLDGLGGGATAGTSLGGTPRRLPALGTPSSGGSFSAGSSPVVSTSVPSDHTPVTGSSGASSASSAPGGVTLVRLRGSGSSSSGASGGGSGSGTPAAPSPAAATTSAPAAATSGLHINAPKFELPSSLDAGTPSDAGAPGSGSVTTRRYTPIRRRL